MKSNASALPPPSPPPTKWWTILSRLPKPRLGCALGAIALCSLAGCATPPVGVEVHRLLQAYPEQAKAAAQLAPDFTRDALKTINRLEAGQKLP